VIIKTGIEVLLIIIIIKIIALHLQGHNNEVEVWEVEGEDNVTK
jgi:hypothetical protein